MPRKRPFGVTLLIWMVLSLSAWGATRCLAALRSWDVLREFGSSLSPLYLVATGAGWGVAGGVLLFGILKRRTWARPAIVASLLVWLPEYWVERIFFETPRMNLPFALTGSVAVVIIVWVLAILPGVKSFFAKSEAHEQPVEEPNSA